MNLPQISPEEWARTPQAIQELLKHLLASTDLSADPLFPLKQRLSTYSHARQKRDPNHVVMVSRQVTARQYKYAMSLARLGWKITLIHHERHNLEDQSCFQQLLCYRNEAEALDMCLRLNPEVYHIFTSWHFELPAYLIAAGLHPVVFDDYDIISGCIESLSSPEVPSEQFRALELYCLDNAKALTCRDGRIRLTKKNIGLLNSPRAALCLDGAISQQQASIVRQPKRSDGIHVAYAGNMADPAAPGARNFHFYLAQRLASSGIHYHIYPSHAETYQQYLTVNTELYSQSSPSKFLHIHHPVPASELIRELSQYHFGIDILTTTVDRTNNDHPFYSFENTEVTLDNKIFDYIGAGLFTLVHKGRWCRRVLERYGLGVRVTSLDNLIEQIQRLKFATFPPIPERLTTDYWAARLTRLYNQVGQG